VGLHWRPIGVLWRPTSFAFRLFNNLD